MSFSVNPNESLREVAAQVQSSLSGPPHVLEGWGGRFLAECCSFCLDLGEDSVLLFWLNGRSKEAIGEGTVEVSKAGPDTTGEDFSSYALLCFASHAQGGRTSKIPSK